MKRKRIVRTAEVTIETDESVVLRGSPNHRSSTLWCGTCGRQVEMVTPEQAAQIAGVGERTVYAWVETGKLHFAETHEGSLLICSDSLTAAGVRRAGLEGKTSLRGN